MCVRCVGPCVRGGVCLAGVRVRVARLGRVGRGSWEKRVFDKSSVRLRS